MKLRNHRNGSLTFVAGAYKEIAGKYTLFFSVGVTNFELTPEPVSSNEIALKFVSDARTELTYSPALTKGAWSSDKGLKKGEVLTLSAEEAKSFTIKFQARNK